MRKVFVLTCLLLSRAGLVALKRQGRCRAVRLVASSLRVRYHDRARQQIAELAHYRECVPVLLDLLPGSTAYRARRPVLHPGPNHRQDELAVGIPSYAA